MIDSLGWGALSDLILAALHDYGPMTRAEIYQTLNLPDKESGGVLSRLLKPRLRPKGPKRIYIKDWVFDEPEQRRYPRPVYALGDKQNKPKPKASHANDVRRWYRKKRIQTTTTSVFHLSVTKKESLCN